MVYTMAIAYHRGVLAETLKERHPERLGGMLAIGASQMKVRPKFKEFGSTQAIVNISVNHLLLRFLEISVAFQCSGLQWKARTS